MDALRKRVEAVEELLRKELQKKEQLDQLLESENQKIERLETLLSVIKEKDTVEYYESKVEALKLEISNEKQKSELKLKTLTEGLRSRSRRVEVEYQLIREKQREQNNQRKANYHRQRARSQLVPVRSSLSFSPEVTRSTDAPKMRNKVSLVVRRSSGGIMATKVDKWKTQEYDELDEEDLLTPQGHGSNQKAKSVPVSLMETWSKDVFFNWLDENDLSDYKALFDKTLEDKKVLKKMWTTHPSRPNFVVFDQGPISVIVQIILEGYKAPLSSLFNYKDFLRTFINTRERLISCFEFFQILKKNFLGDDSTDKIRRTVFYIFKNWVKMDINGADFSDPDFLRQVKEFCDEVQQKHSHFSTEAITLSLSVNMATFQLKSPKSVFLFPPKIPTPFVPQNLEGSFELKDIHPVELARQMTLIEYKLFLDLRRTDFISGGWHRKDKEASSSNLLKLISHSNFVTNWISTEIIRRKTFDLRATTIEYFIAVGQEFRRLNNFNGLVEVLSSLHSSPIIRLKTTWELVQKRSKEIMDKLTNLMSNLGHYRIYTQTLQQLPKTVACLPLLSGVCSDLFLIDEHQRDKLEDNTDWINWNKMTIISKIIDEIFIFKGRYNLQPVEIIQNFILRSQVWEEPDILYEIASMEPDPSKNPNILNELRSLESSDSCFSASDLWICPPLKEEDFQKLFNSEWTVKVSFPAKEVLLRPGATLDSIYRVESGTVSLCKSPPTEDNPPLKRYEKGDIFGEACIFQHEGTLKHLLVAETDVTLSKVPRRGIYNMCRQPKIPSSPHSPKDTPAKNLLSASGTFNLRNSLVSKPTETTNRFFESLERYFAIYMANKLNILKKHSIQLDNTEKQSILDETLRKFLNADPKDEILKYSCCMEGEGLNPFGFLLVCSHSFCFYARLYDVEFRQKYSFSDVTKINKLSKTIKISMEAMELEFGSFVNVVESFHNITTKWKLCKVEQYTENEISNLTDSDTPPTATPPDPSVPHVPRRRKLGRKAIRRKTNESPSQDEADCGSSDEGDSEKDVPVKIKSRESNPATLVQRKSSNHSVEEENMSSASSAPEVLVCVPPKSNSAEQKEDIRQQRSKENFKSSGSDMDDSPQVYSRSKVVKPTQMNTSPSPSQSPSATPPQSPPTSLRPPSPYRRTFSTAKPKPQKTLSINRISPEVTRRSEARSEKKKIHRVSTETKFSIPDRRPKTPNKDQDSFLTKLSSSDDRAYQIREKKEAKSRTKSTGGSGFKEERPRSLSKSPLEGRKDVQSLVESDTEKERSEEGRILGRRAASGRGRTRRLSHIFYRKGSVGLREGGGANSGLFCDLQEEILGDISFPVLTQEDWNLLLKGAHSKVYSQGNIIIPKGKEVMSIYQVVSGSVTTQKQTITPDTFGGIFAFTQFTLSQPINSTYIAAEDNTRVVMMEGYFLAVLFYHRPSVAGRFYEWISRVLAKLVFSDLI